MSDAPEWRNLVAVEASRVTGAVEALVMAYRHIRKVLSKQFARLFCLAACRIRRRFGGLALHLNQPANLVCGAFAAVDVDIDGTSAALQHVDLCLLANLEALEDERRLERGTIQFRDVRAFRHFGAVQRQSIFGTMIGR
jgi:hypothetical protein